MFEIFLRVIAGVLRIFVSVALIVMMLLSVADVVARYFGRPILGATEMGAFLLALTVFGGMGLANAAGAHISVDIFEPRLKKVAPRLHGVFLRALSLITFTLIAWQLTVLALEAHASDRVTLVLQWPLAGVISATVVLAGLAFIIDLVGYRETASSESSPGE